jgi:hypothetical protein
VTGGGGGLLNLIFRRVIVTAVHQGHNRVPCCKISMYMYDHIACNMTEGNSVCVCARACLAAVNFLLRY